MLNYLKQKNKYNTGFTLVEMLIALSIVSVSIVALMSTLASGISDTNYSKNKLEASFLAEEGIEYMRNIRDTYVVYSVDSTTGWADFKNKTTPCQNTNGCYFQTSSTLDFVNFSNLNFTVCPNNGCHLYYDPSVGKYDYQAIGNDSGFVRKIIFTKMTSNDDEIRVTSIVSWAKGSVTFSDNFLNWSGETIAVTTPTTSFPADAIQCALAEDGYCSYPDDSTVFYYGPKGDYYSTYFKTKGTIQCTFKSFGSDIKQIEGAQCYYKNNNKPPADGYVTLPFGVVECARFSEKCEYKTSGTVFYGFNEYTKFSSTKVSDSGVIECVPDVFTPIPDANKEAKCYFLPYEHSSVFKWDPTFCSVDRENCSYNFENIPEGGFALYGTPDKYYSITVDKKGDFECTSGTFKADKIDGANCYLVPSGTGCYSSSYDGYKTSSEYCNK